MVLHDCFCSSARRAARTLTARYEAALSPHGLSVPQFELLALLHGGQRNGRTIANDIGLDAATVSRNLKPMLRRKLVQSTLDKQDARQLQYGLTALGQATFRNALPAWRAAQQHTAEISPAHTLSILHTLAQAPGE